MRTSKVFHGRIPYKVVELKYGVKRQPEALTGDEVAEGVLQQTEQIVNQIQQSLMQSYVRLKHYYDKMHPPIPW